MWEIITKIEAQFYNIAAAVIILIVGLILGLIVKKVLRKILHEIDLDKLVKRLGKNYSLEKRLSSLAAYLVYFVTLVVVLNQLGITSVVLYIVLAAVLLLMGVTILLGLKDFIPNLVSGVVLNRKGYKIGRKIKVKGMEGKIEKIGWLEVELKTTQGDKIYVPNSLLVKSRVWLKRQGSRASK